MNEKKTIRYTRDGMQRVNLVTGKKEQLTQNGESRFSSKSPRRLKEGKQDLSAAHRTAARAAAIRRQRDGSRFQSDGSKLQTTKTAGTALRFQLAGNRRFQVEKGKGVLLRPVKSNALLQHEKRIRSEKEKLRVKYGLAEKSKEKFKSETQKKRAAVQRTMEAKRKFVVSRFSADGKGRIYRIRPERFYSETGLTVQNAQIPRAAGRTPLSRASSWIPNTAGRLSLPPAPSQFQKERSGEEPRFDPKSEKGKIFRFLLRKGRSALGKTQEDGDKEDNFALSALSGGKRGLKSAERNFRVYRKYRQQAGAQANRAVVRRAAMRRAVTQKAAQKAVEQGTKSVVKAAASKAAALLSPKIAVVVVIGLAAAFIILYVASLVQMIASIGSTAAALQNTSLETYVEGLDEEFRDRIGQLQDRTGGDDDVVKVRGLDLVKTDPYELSLLALGEWQEIELTDDTKARLETVHSSLYSYEVTSERKESEEDDGDGWHTVHYTEYTIRISAITIEDYFALLYPSEELPEKLNELETLREIQEEIGDLELDNPAQIIPSEGEYAWPTPGHTHLTSYWGDGRNHKGIDIADAEINGTPIVAMADGTVTRAVDGYGTGYPGSPDGGGYGNHVYLDHGGGLTSRYGHMSRVVVRVGDEVVKGQIIGYVGSSGDSSGPHLHFEIRENGTPKNPMLWYQEDHDT